MIHGNGDYSDPIRIVKGFRRKSFSQSPFTIQTFTNQIGLLCTFGKTVRPGLRIVPTATAIAPFLMAKFWLEGLSSLDKTGKIRAI
jgi:hypothetical protein